MASLAQAIAHVNTPSGVLLWVDVSKDESKEFVVNKGEGIVVPGSLSFQGNLTGNQDADVSQNSGGNLIIVFSVKDGKDKKKVVNVSTFIITSTQPVAQAVSSTNHFGTWETAQS
ncbi:hypothetical protein RSOLAG22IIIB_07665 [Rhizoctonia solani]|uniref:Uncharacterized protein n=1 Tax=Rhizoctonia solani TaxID=456999 RepID=A0A0K6FP28_9AGAM|nr:hypothetical protein RSOLAG22IIIB_07665 [Rhizoctonia solani]